MLDVSASKDELIILKYINLQDLVTINEMYGDIGIQYGDIEVKSYNQYIKTTEKHYLIK